MKFGTSGVRGLVADFSAQSCAKFCCAFLEHMRSLSLLDDGAEVVIGYDLRPSSPEIADWCADAVEAAGFTPLMAGAAPSPAVAGWAMDRGAAAIVVTGSHIPADRNGLKFNRPDGELKKSDEPPITELLEQTSDLGLADSDANRSSHEAAVLADYLGRFSKLLPSGALTGKRIGVYQHSSVARDILPKVLEMFGAEIVAIERSETFIPVDTEAVSDALRAKTPQWANEHSLDAIVSTDGDADRPLLTDENGAVLRGDLLGLLAALYLEACTIVTPVTSNSAIEDVLGQREVIRTRVGSPYVISAMEDAIGAGKKGVVGFEANGGTLLGTRFVHDGLELKALPTRDAFLPILAVLGRAASEGLTISELAQRIPLRTARSGLLRETSSEVSSPLLRRLGADRAFAVSFFAEIGLIKKISTTDGVQTQFENGDVVHYRASGNAPEMRCYTEAMTPERADALLDWGLDQARRHFNEGEASR